MFFTFALLQPQSSYRHALLPIDMFFFLQTCSSSYRHALLLRLNSYVELVSSKNQLLLSLTQARRKCDLDLLSGTYRRHFFVKLVDTRGKWRNIFVEVPGLVRDACIRNGRGAKFIQRLPMI